MEVVDDIYPKDSNRFLEYHKDADGNELYDYTRDIKNFFKNKNNYDHTWDDQYYAKKVDGTEYIPDNKLIPFQLGYPAYPLTKDMNDIYFPKNNDGDEMWFYKTKTGTVIYSYSLESFVRKYPKNKSGREIYPIIPHIDIDDRGNDVLSFFETDVELMYAKDNIVDQNGNFYYYYPLDSGGNEYIFNKNDYVDKIQNFVDYPVSKNGTIIVPNINGTPYFVSHFKTKVSINDITGSVVERYYPNILEDRDFETNVKPVRQQQQQQNRRLDGKYFYVLSKEKNVLHDTLKLLDNTTTNLMDVVNNNNISSASSSTDKNKNLNSKEIPPTSSTKQKNPTSSSNDNNKINFFNKIKFPIIIVVICVILILLMVWGYLKFFSKNLISNFKN